MLFDKTRIPAMVFCTAFHLMNSRLFSIGKHSRHDCHVLSHMTYVFNHFVVDSKKQKSYEYYEYY